VEKNNGFKIKNVFVGFYWFIGFYGFMVFRFSYRKLQKPENTTTRSALYDITEVKLGGRR